MTDRHDIQRARRYIVEFGIDREQFRKNFNKQFVRNNETKFINEFKFNAGLAAEKEFGRRTQPIFLKPKEMDKFKRIIIRHRYWRYNLNTHRIAGKWHGTNKRRVR